ncbi:MAG TPA: hypothetical protein VMV84_05150 [Dehalococcoidales bacterium]|nr:hypothetical protein [Dehalococcoidales bacterium]
MNKQKIRPKLEYILKKALYREALNRQEAAWLLREVDPLSYEAYALMGAANQLNREISGNRGTIHAQIGVNIAPCPHNCGFCSFAAQSGLFKERFDMSPGDVIDCAKRAVAEGAIAVYLMTTANYDFNSLLRVAAIVRGSIPAEISLVANIDDFDLDQAKQMVEAGFQGAYHVVRMGEGRDTRIQPERRLATLRAIRESGLRLAYCVEPIGPEHTVEEIVDKIFIGKEYGAWFSGAMRRTPVAGTPLGKLGALTEVELAKVVAVTRLVMGDSVSINCTHEPNSPSLLAGANLLWAESGSNPRDLEEETTEGRGLNSVQCGQLLREMGYEVLGGAPASFSR